MAKGDDKTLLEKVSRWAQNRPVIVAVIVAVAIITSLLTLTNAGRETWRWLFPKTSIFVECKYGTLPMIVPPEGHINVLIIGGEIGGGGLSELTPLFAQPGSPWNPPKEGEPPKFAYRCELTSYSQEVIFNLSIPVHLTFMTAVPGPDGKGLTSGAITSDRDWPIVVPKLDPPPAAPFVFYVWNCCVPKFVRFRLPRQADTAQGKTVPFIHSTNNLFSALPPASFK